MISVRYRNHAATKRLYMKHTTMKLAKLLLVIILSSVGFCSYAQEDKNDEYVPVSVETYGVPASVIGQFEVLYYGSRVEQTSDGYYMCKNTTPIIR